MPVEEEVGQCKSIKVSSSSSKKDINGGRQRNLLFLPPLHHQGALASVSQPKTRTQVRNYYKADSGSWRISGEELARYTNEEKYGEVASFAEHLVVAEALHAAATKGGPTIVRGELVVAPHWLG